jgi:iron complex outermembrane recepter protein
MKADAQVVLGRLFGVVFGIITACPILAQSAPPVEQSDSLMEIVVTAQRRAENLQRVPISVTAISASTLSGLNITTAEDLSTVVPSLLIQQSDGTATVYLRGVGNSESAVGNEASVPLYVDGVYISRILGIELNLNNVDRVEVLKGPQGTLFGRNSEAGLVQVITRDPKLGDDFHLDVETGLGNYETVQTRSYMSDSFGSAVTGDLAAIYLNQNHGFGTNLFNGQQVWFDKSYALRSKWIAQFSDQTRATLIADFGSSNSDIGMPTVYNRAIGIDGIPPPAIGHLPPRPNYDVYANYPDANVSRTSGISLKVEQDLPFAKLVDIAAYRQWQTYAQFEGDNSIATAFQLQQWNKGRQFSDDLQLISSNGAIKWTAGLYFFKEEEQYPNFNLFGSFIGVPVVDISSHDDTKSYAAYGQATIPLVNKLSFTIGGRYTDDQVTANGQETANIPDLPPIPVIPYAAAQKSFAKWTWRAALDYTLSDDVMVYLSDNRGFKSGVFNTDAFSPNYVNPETLDAYEIGIKSEFLDHKVRFNAAAFYYKITNPQVDANSDSLTVLVNAGEEIIKGLEFDTHAIVAKGLTLNFLATYLDAYYQKFNDAPYYSSNPVPPFGLLLDSPASAAGNRPSRAPRFSANVGFDYDIRIGSGDLKWAANYAYTDKFFWDPDNKFFQSAYGTLDSKVSYAFPNGLTVSAWGRNLTNAYYFVSEFEIANFSGSVGSPGTPRQYGMMAEYKF